MEIKETLDERYMNDAIEHIKCSKARIDARIREILLSDCSKAKNAEGDKMLQDTIKEHRVFIRHTCIDKDEVKDESMRSSIFTVF
ncbi:hypothetical protein [Sulfolobus acidocaldarius]|uniref:Uncharacterized protein n=3 Tax=Sulfolobus acidocaldarius TaxID=2285 RepID=A0A0U3H6Y4_9CREN|nr:hypothetical protein [Sulfolobus acidocaldarius]AGE71809.1 hypothetical protein SacN8_09245 [Sulfolobus acidocaldarius N8]AGE74080.1 hypothetical protein SacRon12I_09265 [Sulfolobus acidocaldarius Ron12/I]ALU29997.1 hypothetical protein ATY89_08670 [Sulfolobus acidocaldarius]ALU30687.1 hypothetical protein ATZ20_00080 [Sulfolobus acidocaldarius]WCM35692.1 hypothetical protein GO597_10285 [Sulfolobus acidocaldarius DSM 639]